MCKRISPEKWQKVMVGLGFVSIGFAVVVLVLVPSITELALKVALIGLGVSMGGLGFQFLTMSRRK